ncbi:putative methyltransferase [Caenibius tardaugens NBRC 16725]|uniref:Putative methyltransferase n=2 Tax=Caenibius TaxID=2827482 RepID=U2ZR61_9SPHN|nr:putative methyltransferase [Caenibius tardaugens NBRC 16725]
MDDTYAFQRHIYDLTRKYYLLGRDRLIRELDVPSGGSVLEIGCGTARNLVLAGRHYPQARLYGLDISEEMLKTARSKLAGTPLAGRIALARADATAFNGASLFGRERFDRIFCSYTLSMIPDWHGTIRRAAQALSPTGSLHIVDFGQQDHLPRAFRFLLQRWLARFHVTPREDLFTVCADIASEQGLHLQMRQLYRDYARMVVLKASG